LPKTSNSDRKDVHSVKCPGDHAGAFVDPPFNLSQQDARGSDALFQKSPPGESSRILVVVIAAPTAAKPKAKNKTKAAARISALLPQGRPLRPTVSARIAVSKWRKCRGDHPVQSPVSQKAELSPP
jgi:hypothetical protein